MGVKGARKATVEERRDDEREDRKMSEMKRFNLSDLETWYRGDLTGEFRSRTGHYIGGQQRYQNTHRTTKKKNKKSRQDLGGPMTRRKGEMKR